MRNTILPLVALLASACGGSSAGPPRASPPAVSAARPITVDADPDSLVLNCIGGRRAWSARDELEPHVAASPVDGDHLVAAWMLRAPGGPGAIQSSVSRDGGASWSSPTTLPMAGCAGGGVGARFTSDPWVSIDGAGRVYVSAIEWTPGDDGDGDSVSRLVVATSVDGSRWSGRAVVSDLATTGAGLDNTAIAAARNAAGRAYVTATRFHGGVGPAGIAATTDGGAAWSALEPAPLPSADAPIALAPQPLVGRDPRELWLVFAHDPRGARVASLHSSDGGSTWGEPVPIASWHRPRNWPTFPGRDEELYVAPDIVSAGIHEPTSTLWVAHQSSGPALEATISLAGSTDGGRTWTSIPVLRPGEVGWRPTLAVTPAGLVAVTWFAPRMGTSGSTHPTAVEVAFFRSTGGGGAELHERRRLDVFDWRPRRNGEWFLGDYHGLTAADGGVMAVYARSTASGVRVHAARAAEPGERGGR